jgi:hypothetical protein
MMGCQISVDGRINYVDCGRMKIVFDTDILSCIAKIKGFDFIKEIWL